MVWTSQHGVGINAEAVFLSIRGVHAHMSTCHFHFKKSQMVLPIHCCFAALYGCLHQASHSVSHPPSHLDGLCHPFQDHSNLHRPIAAQLTTANESSINSLFEIHFYFYKIWGKCSTKFTSNLQAFFIEITSILGEKRNK